MDLAVRMFSQLLFPRSILIIRAKMVGKSAQRENEIRTFTFLSICWWRSCDMIESLRKATFYEIKKNRKHQNIVHVQFVIRVFLLVAVQRSGHFNFLFFSCMFLCSSLKLIKQTSAVISSNSTEARWRRKYVCLHWCRTSPLTALYIDHVGEHVCFMSPRSSSSPLPPPPSGSTVSIHVLSF